MLDFDITILYEVETRILNQAIKRNIDLLPDDFMFQVTDTEWQWMSSQIVMTYPIKRPKTALPYAFTEHGVTMLANVLKSRKARQISISINLPVINNPHRLTLTPLNRFWLNELHVH